MNAYYRSVFQTLCNIFTHTIFYFLFFTLPTYTLPNKQVTGISPYDLRRLNIFARPQLNLKQQQIHWRQIGKKYYSSASCFRHNIHKNILIFDILFTANEIDVHANAIGIYSKLNWSQYSLGNLWREVATSTSDYYLLYILGFRILDFTTTLSRSDVILKTS